jgi:hypothetical protein
VVILWVMLLLIGYLRKAGHNRIATMLDSPYHAFSQVRFSIGIEDLEMKASNVSDNESEW